MEDYNILDENVAKDSNQIFNRTDSCLQHRNKHAYRREVSTKIFDKQVIDAERAFDK